MIRLDLTEWEIMVLRAALTKHAREATTEKHRTAVRTILAKSRAQDDPAAVLGRKGRKRKTVGG